MSKKNPTIREMVAEYLKKNGFGGLYRENDCEDCGCRLEDLFPCSERPGPRSSTVPVDECRAAYEHPCPGPESTTCDGDCLFHMSPNKKKA